MSKPICCPRCRERVRRWLERDANQYKRLAVKWNENWTSEIAVVRRLCVELCGPAPRPKAKPKKKGKR